MTPQESPRAYDDRPTRAQVRHWASLNNEVGRLARGYLKYEKAIEAILDLDNHFCESEPKSKLCALDDILERLAGDFAAAMRTP